MRSEPGSSRFRASTNLPSHLAFVAAVASGQANTSEAETVLPMQSQCTTLGEWGELTAAHREGEMCASTLAHWWIIDSTASLCAGLDLFTEVLTEDVLYFRRRTTNGFLNDLTDSSDYLHGTRISDVQIAKLQQILKQHFGLDYSAEEAQDAGRAILRFVGLKLYQQLEKDRRQDTGVEQRRGQ